MRKHLGPNLEFAESPVADGSEADDGRLSSSVRISHHIPRSLTPTPRCAIAGVEGATQGGVAPEDRRWSEPSRVIEGISAQVQTLTHSPEADSTTG